MARDIAAANGANFAAVLQPVAFVGNPAIDHRIAKSPNDLALAAQFEAVYPLISNFARAAGLELVDLSGIYDGCDDRYFDFCHVGPQGHYRLADALSRHLLAK